MVLWKRKEVIYGKPRDKYSLRKSEPPHLPWCRRIRYTTDKIGIIRGQLRICRYARGKCSNPEEKAVHFFLDDYQFDTLWRNPDRYVDKLSKFRYILTPDFSTYTDFPKVIQIYNHYRKHWIGAYLQEYGCRVIPTISWSTPDSYDWCFDGEPKGGTVAVSSVGCMNGKKKKELFLSGYDAMIEKLHPESIIFYGKMPEECKGNIVRIKSFSDRFSKAICEG